MDVKMMLVILAVLMPLLQASGEMININLNIGGNTGGSGAADKSQNMVTALLLDQNKKMQEQNQKQQEQIKELQERDKDMQEQIKTLTVDQCRTKTTCCNKTLGGCPSGYERFCEKPDMCYKFSSDEKNYTDAKSACLHAAGGRLAMPKDKATNDVLVKARHGRGICWIGLTEQVKEGIWVWEDGTKLGTGWNNWGLLLYNRITQLNRINNCATQDAIGEWSDTICGVNMYYICEVKATTAP